jgi:hypothetical protein
VPRLKSACFGQIIGDCGNPIVARFDRLFPIGLRPSDVFREKDIRYFRSQCAKAMRFYGQSVRVLSSSGPSSLSFMIRFLRRLLEFDGL